MRRRRCRREFIWPFHFYFPDKCTCPPHHFFWAKFPVFSFLLFCLAFHGARWTPFQGPENKNVFVFVFFPFFFLLRFFEPSFFLSGARDNLPPNFRGSRSETIGCLILGPAPKTIFYRFFPFFPFLFSSGFFPYPSPTPFVFAKYTKAICEGRDDSMAGLVEQMDKHVKSCEKARTLFKHSPPFFFGGDGELVVCLNTRQNA